MTPPDPPQPPDGPSCGSDCSSGAPGEETRAELVSFRLGRPGRPLGPIQETCDTAHRAWLEPVREAYLQSPLTMSVLSARLHMAKSKISELMSGRLYPRWELLGELAAELGVPARPLYRLWLQAAPEFRRRSRSPQEPPTAPVAVRPAPPMDHTAFRALTENGYDFYASVFLPEAHRETAVRDTYDQLWLSWTKALASSDTRRHAWSVLRATVMSRTPLIDGRPQFTHAAFDTVALRSLSRPEDVEAAVEQLTETQTLFRAMSRLPGHQLDVVVLRSLGGMAEEEVSSLLGVPLATVRSDERHATRFLDSTLCNCPPTDPEGTPS
ncbi:MULTISPECIES: sigma factor-like helix-turn-helix DNA-binding protein [unclassified Streptomyces]|uniref:sigma factor-like helix-turn-helix DNA-binding protein n=1 Tax=unclassified Streptomyces TaxID=2593676 RepID=UPI00403C5774